MLESGTAVIVTPAGRGRSHHPGGWRRRCRPSGRHWPSVASGTATMTMAQADPEVARRAWPRWLASGWPSWGSRRSPPSGATAVRGCCWARSGCSARCAERSAVSGAGRDGLDRRIAHGSASARPWRASPPWRLPRCPGPWPAGCCWSSLRSGSSLGGSLALLSRGPVARRGGFIALVWSALVTLLLVGTGVGADWERARNGATLGGRDPRGGVRRRAGDRFRRAQGRGVAPGAAEAPQGLPAAPGAPAPAGAAAP